MGEALATSQWRGRYIRTYVRRRSTPLNYAPIARSRKACSSTHAQRLAELAIRTYRGLSSLQVHFVAPFPYHLNVSQKSGQVCLGLLGDDKWEPSYMGMEHIVQALVAILIRPEPSSAMDHELLNNYLNLSFIYTMNAEGSAKVAAKHFKKLI
jgi:hypothetical protein